MSLTSFWCFYYQLWAPFTLFSSVSIADFKQVNVSWEVHGIRSHWIQDFFSIFVTKDFLILKYFSWFWNIFLDFNFIFSFFFDSEIFFWISQYFFSILKVFSWWRLSATIINIPFYLTWINFFVYKTQADNILLNFLCNMNQPFAYKTTQNDKFRLNW